MSFSPPTDSGGKTAATPERSTSFREFLARSLSLLSREAPTAHTAMCSAAGERELLVTVGEEVVSLEFVSGRVYFLTTASQPRIDLRTTRADILDLIDGELSLLEAVLADRLLLRGAPEDVIAFHDCLKAYLHGAFRARSFPGLLAEYRREPSSTIDSQPTSPSTSQPTSMKGV